MTDRKPYSLACDQNREPILAVLRDHFADRDQVLEIGSGTGQHAVYFAAAMPHLVWQTSDCAENLSGIRLWLDEAALPNTLAPLALDVNGTWPTLRFDAIFTANTLHIMGWPEVEALFGGLAGVMTEDAKLAIYGPFNYGGHYTSDSNATFDRWLKAQAPHMGIRDFEAVDKLAQATGLCLLEDRAMPANNRCLIWQRSVPDLRRVLGGQAEYDVLPARGQALVRATWAKRMVELRNSLRLDQEFKASTIATPNWMNTVRSWCARNRHVGVRRSASLRNLAGSALDRRPERCGQVRSTSGSWVYLIAAMRAAILSQEPENNQ